MNLKTFISVLFFLQPFFSFGQDVGYNMTGKVLTREEQPVAFATVNLVRQADQILVKAEFTDEEGNYFFSSVAPHTYELVIEHPDFALSRYSPIQLDKDEELETIFLDEQKTELDEILIVVKKPFIEQHFDKTVLNVEQSLTNAGNTAFEVLEKAPGIAIDQNDDISMRGRPGVVVMINGKQVPMSGADLANMLRGLPADAVSKIEIITNPSSKYDAAGNAGIIDIKLKKDNKIGTNGSISSTVGTGKFIRTNHGIQLNHRNRKFNIFGNYNFFYKEDFTDIDFYREFRENNELTGGYDQQNKFRWEVNSHTARIGIDYDISPSTLLGLAAYGVFADFERINNNRSVVLGDEWQPQSYFLTVGETGNEQPSGGINLNFKHVLDTLGREISGDVDYVNYRKSDVQNFNTTYFNPNNETTKDPYVLSGFFEGKLEIRSLKLDYSQPLLSIQGELAAGVKSSLVDADNDLEFYDRSGGGNVLDENISNRFLYWENINAAYLNLSSEREKFNFQLGLRVENTIANGEQVMTGEKFGRNYTQFFPSGFIGFTPNGTHEFGLSLSRRINRPTYNQLNPFKTFLDPTTYSTGNPYLNPELSNAVEFTHTLSRKFVMKYSYSRTKDVILRVLSLDPDQDQVVVQTFLNVAKLDYYGFTLTAPFSIGKWFQSINNGTLYYRLYSGALANTEVHNGQPAFNINSNNTVTLSKNWTAEIVGMYRSSEIFGLLEVEPWWMLSAGVQKQLWDGKGTLKLNVSDIFYSRKIRGNSVVTGYTENFYQVLDTRVINLGFTYRFGGSTVAPERKRTGGAEEEKSRVD